MHISTNSILKAQESAILNAKIDKSSQSGSLWDKIDSQKMKEAMQRRAHADRIIGCQIRKRKNKITPSITIVRKGVLTTGETIEVEDLNKLGFSEWVELYEQVGKSKSMYKDAVAKELERRFEKVKRLNIKLSESAKPSDPQAELEDANIQPLKRRKKIVSDPNANLFQNLNPAELITVISKQKVMKEQDSLNLIPPSGIPSHKEALFLTSPEHGLVFHDLSGALSFQRTAELPKASTMHLFTLHWICKRFPQNSQGYEVFLLKEAESRGVDLNKPPTLEVKKEFIEMSTGLL